MNLDLGVSVVPDTSSFTSMNQYINQVQEAIKGNKNIGDEQKQVIQGMIDAWKGYFGEMARQYANDLAEYGDYYTQVDIIREKYRKKIATAEGMGNTSLISALQKSEEMDLFKLTTDYQNFFGAVEAMSMEAANTVADKTREMLNSAFRSGAISAREYMKELERAVLGQLSIAMGDGDADGSEARKLVVMHRRWIALNWGCEPQNEAYLGLAHGYLADQRFVDYYDKPCGTGATAFLVQAIESSLTRA